MIAKVSRFAALVAAAAFMPAATAVAEPVGVAESSGGPGTAVVDLVLTDFAKELLIRHDGEFVGFPRTSTTVTVTDGEWINLGSSAEHAELGWMFDFTCPRDVGRAGWTGDYEGPGDISFRAVAGEHYTFMGLCEARLETLPGSFAVGEMPRDIGPPFGVEYEAELTSSEGWVQSNSLDGTLRDGEPLITTASFEDRGVTGEITTTIDVLDFSIDADGNLVDVAVGGTQKTDWSLGGERLVPVTHAAGTLADGVLVITLHSYEGGPLLAEYVMASPQVTPRGDGAALT